jgi:hypothetical protein
MEYTALSISPQVCSPIAHWACQRRRAGVHIVQAYAAEINRRRPAGTVEAQFKSRAVGGHGGTQP